MSDDESWKYLLLKSLNFKGFYTKFKVQVLENVLSCKLIENLLEILQCCRELYVVISNNAGRV